MNHLIPSILALAASSMIYISVSDLIPNLHTKTETKERTLRKGTGESSLDGVIAIEGYDANLLELQANKVNQTVRESGLSLSTLPHQIHTLSYILRTPD